MSDKVTHPDECIHPACENPAPAPLPVRGNLPLCDDHSRVDAEIGWVLIERQYYPDAALLYPTYGDAVDALENSLLVDSLCEEDCLDAWVPEKNEPALLAGFEVILPD